MKLKRFGAWFASVLLLVTIVASGAHAHHAPNASSDNCVACTLAHAPAADDSSAPAPYTLERTGEIVLATPALPVLAPLAAVSSSRAPPA